ncbi:MAG: Lrp/AsnC family transcriptional regulator [gamma proteobacterium endosymbiont of Lamellibrachia anaximandri]|nr:Lrp/AsnC family transcriptional regulator [gamma proteobacterium endosymbiont of Lamellibrachia anaximandri]MBL3532752.1 Lrp/AsnC family transcriptional regulator [gamma proteobacterium endosymbiont of Lamellibrachia anaximandri]MBL3598756.1 Lrp/AsnC family transcriptional regulator [gamma proteobacterium endosymbiont of Lamellibrachia anaximandri]
MDSVDRAIINQLQGGFPISGHPYREMANRFGINEVELIQRLQQMLEKRQLSRFGPLYNAERLGGGLSLCAMSIPEEDFERVAEQVNAFSEVAHNYARDHRLNMWFVLATETPTRIESVLAEIEDVTGYQVYNMPKKEEFFVGLKFEV